jgi:hypothetical protein
MARLELVVDTETNEMAAVVNGVAMVEPSSVSAYLYGAGTRQAEAHFEVCSCRRTPDGDVTMNVRVSASEGFDAARASHAGPTPAQAAIAALLGDACFAR